MNDNDVWYVTFHVEIGDTEYSYQGNAGNSEMKLSLPAAALTSLNAGNLFDGLIQSALNNLKNELAKTKEEEENE